MLKKQKQNSGSCGLIDVVCKLPSMVKRTDEKQKGIVKSTDGKRVTLSKKSDTTMKEIEAKARMNRKNDKKSV